MKKHSKKTTLSKMLNSLRADASTMLIVAIAILSLLMTSAASNFLYEQKIKQAVITNNGEFRSDKESLGLHDLTLISVTPAPPAAAITNCKSASSNSDKPEMIYAYDHRGGGAGGYEEALKLWYTDKHALILGSGNVSSYPQGANGAHVNNPDVGSTTQRDGPFPYAPTIFLTDTSRDSNSRAGDAENGGTPIIPNDVYGSWKALGGNDPLPSNGWTNLAGGDPFPSQSNGPGQGRIPQTTYGSEIIWNIADLTYRGQPLEPGKQYRVEFVIHSGDGQLGVGCTNIQIGQFTPNSKPPNNTLPTPTPIPTPTGAGGGTMPMPTQGTMPGGGNSPMPMPTQISTTGGGSNVSGETMPTANIKGWRLIFTDDFPTDVSVGNFPSAVSSKWGAYPDGWKDTSKNGVYSPTKVVSIKNGVMNMFIHTENGTHMVAAPVPKLPGATSAGGMLYGRYAVRFKSDPIPCYKTAWLLWPDSETWPRDGEIDFPEGDLDGTIGAFMHRQNGSSGGDQDGYSSSITYGSWHTAITEWGPNQTNFILDGKTIGSSTSRIPNTPMHYVMQTETGLGGCTPSSNASGNLQVDWVSIWKYDPSI